MNFLLTNDDGWDAPGLRALQTVAARFGQIWTVAPSTHMSGISHQLTFEEPMTLVERASNSFSLTGTPADCTRIGLTQLGVEFDAVISGINNGANLGADIYVSGTVAAAREAWLMGVDGWALSQHRLNMAGAFDWETAHELAARVLKQLIGERESRRQSPGSLSAGKRSELINVNLPDCSALSEEESQAVVICDCPMDPNGLPVAYEKDEGGCFVYAAVYNDRARLAGHDIETCFSGKVSLSVL